MPGRLPRLARRRFTACLTAHPFLRSRARPRVSAEDAYNCAEALGLVRSLGWTTVPGPFVGYKLPARSAEAAPRAAAADGEPAVGEQVNLLGFPLLYAGQDYYEILPDEAEEEPRAADAPWAAMPENAHILRMEQPGKLFFFSREVLEGLAAYMREAGAGALFVNSFLSPLQLRNMRRKLGGPAVVDRLGLILQIFSQRARNELAKLQIALVCLQYIKAHLVREDELMLSVRDLQGFDVLHPAEPHTRIASAKQAGTRGATGGEGERELELQRRQAKQLESQLRDRIRRAEAAQGAQAARRPATLPTVALIGYTNAGKSALMNRFAGEEVAESRDMLFQTLYTVKRRVRLRGAFEAQLIDTIGFISELPAELVAPFAATLEAVKVADIVLHVRDISHPRSDAQKAVVLAVLDRLGLSALRAEKRLVEVRNKVDLLRQRADVEPVPEDEEAIYVSATDGEGLGALKETIQRKVYALFGCFRHQFEHSAAAHPQVVAWLRE